MRGRLASPAPRRSQFLCYVLATVLVVPGWVVVLSALGARFSSNADAPEWEMAASSSAVRGIQVEALEVEASDLKTALALAQAHSVRVNSPLHARVAPPQQGSGSVVFVGHCVGADDDYDARTPEARRALVQRALPLRDVRTLVLLKDCSLAPGQPALPKPDIIFAVNFWKINRTMLDAVRHVREATHKSRAAAGMKPNRTAVDDTDLVYYKDSHLVPTHRRGRTMTIALNGEWFSGTNWMCDIVVDTTDRGYRFGVGVYWPMAARWFSPGMGNDAFFAHTAADLVVPTAWNALSALRAKTHFCAFMVSKCDNPNYYGASGTLRVALFDVLSATYKVRRAASSLASALLRASHSKSCPPSLRLRITRRARTGGNVTREVPRRPLAAREARRGRVAQGAHGEVVPRRRSCAVLDVQVRHHV